MQDMLIQNTFNAISEGIQEDYQALISNRNLATSNSKGSLRWDLINTNLKEMHKPTETEIAFVKMGFWEIPLLLDKKEQQIYSIMNYKRYLAILSDPEKKAPLYMKALIELNEDLGILSPSLFEFDNNLQQLRIVLNTICNCFSKNFNNIHYKIIVFETDIFNNVIDLSLRTLDVNFEELAKESLLDKVSPIHSNIVVQVSPEEIYTPQLKLKRKSEERRNEKKKISLKNIGFHDEEKSV